MSVRTLFAALAWTGVLVLAVFVTVRGINPDVHWALATPQGLEPATLGSSEVIRPSRPAAAPGPDATPRPKPAVAAPLRPKTAASRPTGATHRWASKQPAAPLKLRWHSRPDSVKAFSSETHYLSLPAYVRYVVHEQTGRWITYAEAAKMVKDKAIPLEAAASP